MHKDDDAKINSCFIHVTQRKKQAKTECFAIVNLHATAVTQNYSQTFDLNLCAKAVSRVTSLVSWPISPRADCKSTYSSIIATFPVKHRRNV
jgi:hypothetical protein